MIYSRKMNAELNLWDQLTRVVIFLLFVAGLLGVAVWYMPLIHQNEGYRREILRYDGRIQKEEEIAKQLRNSIEALRRDPKAVERLARERLGYAKPGETVIRFETAPTNSVPRR
jgi:cell division protein FtsB